MKDDLLEAWRTNNRINFYLIDRISKEGMACSMSKRGGRDVAHESHHRGNIMLTIKERGHNVDKAMQYGIWAWDQI